ncbi:hypothetical protein CXG81DRAFT_26100 [Caulochytrium protostelioides]|uniref:Uncharacterized protein n=1 Tax=Caulochytrium protostelioides TaxID=1555241 RepID=A0A4V1IT47_9FUNG|nr:hypothetical protein CAUPRSCDRAFT_12501 [Caulochytrium protostelioides]RKP01237.1 hypothetical protein CXG81DRAFT_26100 [Caulochytrium protostelioides]|eukprot:RKP01237.1 hypothetical protein CXG81DRAFT_26100 [Caulochytrium protostelioides]
MQLSRTTLAAVGCGLVSLVGMASAQLLWDPQVAAMTAWLVVFTPQVAMLKGHALTSKLEPVTDLLHKEHASYKPLMDLEDTLIWKVESPNPQIDEALLQLTELVQSVEKDAVVHTMPVGAADPSAPPPPTR